MTKLYFLKHSKSWLNVDQSLNIDLFYEHICYLIKKGNEISAKEIMIFYKQLSSTIFTCSSPALSIAVCNCKNICNCSICCNSVISSSNNVASISKPVCPVFS